MELIVGMHQGEFEAPARVLYRAASATMHGVQWGVMQNLQVGPESQPGVFNVQTKDPTLTEVVTLAAMTVQAVMSATERRNEYYGADQKTWNSWKAHLYSKLRPYLPD